MEKIQGVLPRNKDSFDKLVTYGAEIACRCELNGIAPFVYGSLAYLSYSNDSEVEVSDIDFLVPESDFERIISIFKGVDGINIETTNYHSLKLLKGSLKVSFDAIEHYLVGLSTSCEEVDYSGNKFKIVSYDVLVEVYDRGAKSIPVKREAYERKLQNLKHNRHPKR